MKYLVNLGNQAAAKRLSEIDQMCAHLAVQTETPNLESIQPGLLMQPFSFERVAQTPQVASETIDEIHQARQSSSPAPTLNNAVPNPDTTMSGAADFASLVLEGEDNLYWMYHNPSLSLTGVELVDWEILENTLNE